MSAFTSGGSAKADLMQFVREGAKGDRVLSALEEGLEGRVGALTVRPKSETRVCTTIVSEGEAMEFIEPMM